MPIAIAMSEYISISAYSNCLGLFCTLATKRVFVFLNIPQHASVVPVWIKNDLPACCLFFPTNSFSQWEHAMCVDLWAAASPGNTLLRLSKHLSKHLSKQVLAFVPHTIVKFNRNLSLSKSFAWIAPRSTPPIPQWSHRTRKNTQNSRSVFNP